MSASISGNLGPSTTINDGQSAFGPAPSIAVPSGGGSLRSMGDTFSMDNATGTGTYTIPIAVTPGRAHAETALSLAYSSGGGNGIFGLGWSHSFDINVSRKTTSSLPRYLDEEDSDTFVLTGYGELVPCFEPAGSSYQKVRIPADDRYIVQKYRPRLEKSFARIEFWRRIDDQNDTHWRVISPENELSIFGRDEQSRISARSELSIRTFTWLLSEQYDCKGNARQLTYKTENDDNVDKIQACEENRTEQSRSRMRYLKSVFYGNRKPLAFASLDAVRPGDFMFDITFDYGEHQVAEPTTAQKIPWPVREDPFSSYRSGFELRCYRRCQRILMFHHIPEELGRMDYLVHSTELTYDNSPHASHLLSLQHVGYLAQDQPSPAPGNGSSPYQTASLPPLRFEYTSSLTQQQLSEVSLQTLYDEHAFENFAAAGSSSSMWLDLLGEGTPGVLASEGGEWYYKQNISPAMNKCSSFKDQSKPSSLCLEPLAVIPARPLQHGQGMTLVDVGANGSLDILCRDESLHGFFRSRSTTQVGEDQSTKQDRIDDRTNGRLGWDDYQPFVTVQNVDMGDFARLIDLTGDGNADILIYHDNQLVWFPSLGEKGYGPASNVIFEVEGEGASSYCPMQDWQYIHLADMSGDGLTDVVYIRNGSVCYWPNLGFGRFGRPVHMDCCPNFDDDNAFSSARVFLCDIDGSGTTDVVYNRNGVMSVYLNSSGNKFEDAAILSVPLPQTQNHSMAAVDLFGNGTACIVWSTDLPSHSGPASLQYVDLTNGIKPHLLQGIHNGIGSVTHLEYCPSTSYYCKDKLGGKPWVTKLPFPVHCVNTVTKHDLITNRKFTQRFSYHHGTYDHVEREFAGFAMVEQWDADISASSARKGDAEQSNAGLDSPPVHTKTWYHTGVFTHHDDLTSQLVNEYYGSGDKPNFYEGLLQDSILYSGGDLKVEEARQATHALKGTVLRQEISAAAAESEDSIPFTITDRCSTIKVLQPSYKSGVPIVAFVAESESTLTTLEAQNEVAGRVAHSVVIERDEYGRAIKEAEVHYGRKGADASLPVSDHGIQEKTRIRYTETVLTNAVDVPGQAYRVPKPLKISVSETEVPQFRGMRYEKADIPAPEQAHRISETEIIYRTDDLMSTGERLEALALPGAVYRLSMTQKQLDQFNPPGDTSSTSSKRETLIAEGGYVDHKKDGNLWARQLAPTYHPLPTASPAEERDLARSSFYSARRAVDTFGNASLVDWDPYSIAPRTTIDALDNRTTGLLDYRVLQMRTVIDINGNKKNVLFDALGGVTALASSGKNKEGDSLIGLTPQLSSQDISDFFAQPTAHARALLGSASTRFVTDPSGSNGSPVRLAQISRERHASDSSQSRLQIQIQYMDGLGRQIQTKVLAEPDRAAPTLERWRCSEWNVVNNKGLEVERFEPFFDKSAAFVPQQKHGVSTLHLYDALGREVLTILPNATWTKQHFTPWYNVRYDESDTLELRLAEEPLIHSALQSLVQARYPKSWLEQRMNLPDGDRNRQAALQSKVYGCTPASTHLDAKARPFLQQKMLPSGSKTYVKTILDHNNQPLEVQDTGGRIVSICAYDLSGRQVYQHSIDSGEHWTLFTATGEALQQHGSRGHRLRYTYDALRRNVAVFCRSPGQNSAEYMMTQTMYGDNDTSNAKGKPIKHMDQSGVTSTPCWDMSGNCLLKEVCLTEAYSQEIDWQHPVKLQSKKYTAATKYDALGRITLSIAPDDTVTRTSYLTGGMVDEVCVNVRSEKDAKGWKWRIASANKQYDAHGRLTSEIRGNGVLVNLEFDRLTQQISRRKLSRAGMVLQDIQYIRDVNHDVVYVSRDSQLASITRLEGSADSAYEYDALRRLVKASGREDVGLTQGRPDAPGGALPPSSSTGMKRFTETYTYDLYDNMTTLDHRIDDAKVAGWSRQMVYGTQSMRYQNFTGNRLINSSIGKLSEAYTYDESGNMISMPHMSKVTWDVSNKMRSSSVQVTTSSVPETTWFVYNSDGQRVRKVTERARGSTAEKARKLSEHIYISEYDLYQEYSGLEAVQKSCESIRVEEEESPTVTIEHWSHLTKPLMRFQYKNDQESVSLELDEKGQEISYEEYSAFGSTTYTRSTKDAPKPFRYATKRRDRETGLFYFGGRYYAPWLCRWMSSDPSGLVDGTNTYSYCAANPTNYTDPDGNMMRATNTLASNVTRTTLSRRPAITANHMPRTTTNLQQSQQNTLRMIPRTYSLPNLIPRSTASNTSLIPTTPPIRSLTTTFRSDSYLQGAAVGDGGYGSGGSGGSSTTQSSGEIKVTETDLALIILKALVAGVEITSAINEAQKQQEQHESSGEENKTQGALLALAFEGGTTALTTILTRKYTIGLEAALKAQKRLFPAEMAAVYGAGANALAHAGIDRATENLPGNLGRFGQLRSNVQDTHAVLTMNDRAGFVGFMAGQGIAAVQKASAVKMPPPSQGGGK